MSTHTNEMKAFRLIREGMDDETIRIQTGYSKAVIIFGSWRPRRLGRGGNEPPSFHRL